MVQPPASGFLCAGYFSALEESCTGRLAPPPAIGGWKHCKEANPLHLGTGGGGDREEREGKRKQQMHPPTHTHTTTAPASTVSGSNWWRAKQC